MAPLSRFNFRLAQPADKIQVLNFLAQAGWKHQHLDWLEAVDLIKDQLFFLCFDGDQLSGCLSSPPISVNSAWIRILAIRGEYAPAMIWEPLWSYTKREFVRLGITEIAMLALENWVEPLLVKADFKEVNAVIFLEWTHSAIPAAKDHPGELREIGEGDLERIHALDKAAFDRLWQNTKQELNAALQQSSIATLIEHQGQPIGFQLATTSAWGGHLARLAVHPEWQGQGVGHALVNHLLREITRQGIHRLTVNTQKSNWKSINLYRRLNFLETGDQYPVFAIQL